MNLLIVGNGFDLAHGLPTRYTDFLRYCRDYNEDNLISKSNELNEEFISFVKNNIWLKFFLNSTSDLDNSKTWIDFEKEVAQVVRNIDLANPKIEDNRYFNAQSEITIEFLSNSNSERAEVFISQFCTYDERMGKFVITINSVTDIYSFIDFVYYQLRDFTRAFEIYCQKINETPIAEPIITSDRKKQMDKANFQTESYSHQARNASGYINRKDEVAGYEKLRDEASKEFSSLSSGIRIIDYLSMSKFDCILSFNYTNTYERLYGSDKTQYCYIHGKAQEKRNETNLIFGIDDDLPRGEESNNFKLIRFKKYYQRIIFKTGSEYRDWLNPQDNQTTSQNYVHIVGHSLDVSDYDVLYEIFSNQSFKIIVYYYCSEDFEDKVQKVIKLLAYKGINGRDELIRRVHGIQWSIKFVNQYDGIEGLFIKHEKTVNDDAQCQV
jgi:hypothetical protein